jgi:cytochrome c oxidase subunit 3
MAQAVTAEQRWWNGGKSPYNVEYGKLMMWFFLMSDAFTFGAFLISYGTIRMSSNSWPNPNEVFRSFPGWKGDMPIPLAFVSLMTFILIMSSVTMVLAVGAGHSNDRKGVMKWMFFTILGGIAFLSCQAWEWTHLYMRRMVGRNPFLNMMEHNLRRILPISFLRLPDFMDSMFFRELLLISLC